ncbi:MAG: type II toxin-antitoxin system VapC family toxin [Pseudomonadota bacterium]
MFLLDTVIISELRKAKPDAGVVRWISQQQDSQLFLSAVTLGEIERGIEKQRKTAPEFAAELAAWIEELMQLYADRILPVTAGIARCWGRLSARLGNEGADLLIAATAQMHGLVVITRNTRDFEPTGVKVLNPYSKKT